MKKKEVGLAENNDHDHDDEEEREKIIKDNKKLFMCTYSF